MILFKNRKLSVSIKILIFVFSVSTFTLAQTLSQLQLVDKPTILLSEIISKEIKDSNGEVCAGLMVVSDLEGMRFDSYNKIVRINSLPGKDLLFLSPSEEVVTVYKSGYTPLQIVLRDQGIRLESGKVWQIKVTGDVKKDQIPINIITNPSSDGIYIDGELKGTGTTHKVAIGKHAIRIIKKGYITVIDTINVTQEKILFPYTLEINKPVVITLRTVPDGASISLNGNDKGRTNKQVFELPGKYQIKMKKSGYDDYETEVEIKAVGKNDFVFNLVKNAATILVEVNPVDAEFYFDGELKSSKTFDVKPGIHYLEIKKENYLSVADTLNISSADTIKKSYTLLSNTSRLYLTISPNDADVEINSQKITHTNEVELPVGNYYVEVKRDGYETHTETFSLARDQQLRKSITLQPILGSLQLSVSPIEARVQLIQNGKTIKSWIGTKLVDSLIVGKYSVRADFSGYSAETKDVMIEKNIPAILEVNLIPQKNLADVNLNSISSENKSIRNLRLEKGDGVYTIRYDLDGELNDDFKLELFLMDKSTPDFEKLLISVSGDVGEGKYVGRDKRIIWKYKDEYKGGIINDNLYLKLNADKQGGGIPWYVWAGGAVVGGVVAILVGGGSKDSGGGTTAVTNIPTPPIPPGN